MKLSFLKTDFIELENITICKMIVDFSKLGLDPNTKIFNKSIKEPIEITAKSKLHPDDKYDALKGRIISESRAKQKAYLIAMRLVEKNMLKFQRMFQDAEDCYFKLETYMEREYIHIAKYLV